LAVLEEEVLLARGYGYADAEQDEIVQPGSLFRIASISKPITAVAVLKLAEEGKLQLDAPVFQVVYHLHPAAGAEMDPRLELITIQHLLEHTAGWDSAVSIDPMFQSREIAQEMGMKAPADCAAIIRYMLGTPLDFDPGSRYAYSNFGYCVLGRVIEQVSGQSYEDYVQTQILAPIGIEDMRLGRSLPSDRFPGEVCYYHNDLVLTQSVYPEFSEPVPWPYGGFYLEAMDAHGGWLASAEDLAQFASALEGDSSTPLLSLESLSQIFSRNETSSYAYGWKVRREGNRASWWMTGSMPGTSSVLYRTSSGLIWAALFNASPDTPGDEFLFDVITAMGRAALMDKLIFGGLGFIAAAVVVVFVLIRRRRRKNYEG
jgi:N-acyl-D-amino-acid deacylase